MKKVLTGVTIFGVLALIYVLLSPYQSQFGRNSWAIVESVEIEAPAEKLYAYLGNSANAADWSSYVIHIEPLNSDSFADGTKNSRRRCYYKKDENRTWDEVIDTIAENRYRRLHIYNLQNFPMQSEHLLTEQIYITDGVVTKLSLTLFLDPEASFTDYVKMQAAAYIVTSIFEANLQKIKNINER